MLRFNIDNECFRKLSFASYERTPARLERGNILCLCRRHALLVSEQTKWAWVCARFLFALFLTWYPSFVLSAINTPCKKKTKQDNMPDRGTRRNSEVLTQEINRIARGDGTTDRSQWMLFIENSSRGSKFEIPFYYYIVLAPVCLNAVHYLTISPYDWNCVRQYRSTHEKRHDSFYCCFVICNLMNTHAINFI